MVSTRARRRRSSLRIIGRLREVDGGFSCILSLLRDERIDNSRITDGGISSTVRERHCESVGDEVFQEEERESRGSPQNSSILHLFLFFTSFSFFLSLL